MRATLFTSGRLDATKDRRNYIGMKMIAPDQELQITLERVAQFHKQLANPRNKEANPENYHAAASGFLSEVDRM